jgi:hypothetical protein
VDFYCFIIFFFNNVFQGHLRCFWHFLHLSSRDFPYFLNMKSLIVIDKSLFEFCIVPIFPHDWYLPGLWMVGSPWLSGWISLRLKMNRFFSPSIWKTNYQCNTCTVLLASPGTMKVLCRGKITAGENFRYIRDFYASQI